MPATIVANDGPRVTYAWNGDETRLDRVYSLATSYCNGWHAPPRLVGDDVEGKQHRTTFACVPPPTMPFNRSAAVAMQDLTKLSARAVVDLLARGEVAPIEAVDAALVRIAAVDPEVNAVPTLCAERARECARRLAPPAETGRGWLAGLPVLIKDLVEVAGVRSTHGSPDLRATMCPILGLAGRAPGGGGRHRARQDQHARVRRGANTFNEVFGATRNPWNTALTCGGSSGGAAVALATGMAWLADGSDLGGSLRTPASFCGVVGLRPSPGRVPHGPSTAPFATLAVEGPMARDVRDLALMLDAMAGLDARDPLSYDRPETAYATTVERRPRLGRVAFTPDLGGITPVDPRSPPICRQAAGQLAALGAEVDEAAPDLGNAVEVFTVLRAALFATNMAPLLDQHRDRLKPEVVWNIERGLASHRRRDRPGRARARPAAAADGRVHGPLRPAVVPGGDRAAVPGRDPLPAGAERPPVPQLHRLGDHRLRDQLDGLSCLVAAMRLHRHRAARRAADGGPAARRSRAAGRGGDARGRDRPRGLGPDRSPRLTDPTVARYENEATPRRRHPGDRDMQQQVADRLDASSGSSQP